MKKDLILFTLGKFYAKITLVKINLGKGE